MIFSIVITHDNALSIGIKLKKTMIIFCTMGFYLNPLKLSLKLSPTTIGVSSDKLDQMWASIGYTRSNEIGFGLFKIIWSI